MLFSANLVDATDQLRRVAGVLQDLTHRFPDLHLDNIELEPGKLRVHLHGRSALEHLEAWSRAIGACTWSTRSIAESRDPLFLHERMASIDGVEVSVIAYTDMPAPNGSSSEPAPVFPVANVAVVRLPRALSRSAAAVVTALVVAYMARRAGFGPQSLRAPFHRSGSGTARCDLRLDWGWAAVPSTVPGPRDLSGKGA